MIIKDARSILTGIKITDYISNILQILSAELSIPIGKVIRPHDPLFSVARGCLIAAEMSTK